MTIQKCLCLCICEQKLLTNTSKNRNRCSGCFIGNCRGKGLLRTYAGGRFEIIKSGKDIAQAYPFNLSEVKDNEEPSIVGEYRITTKEESDEKDSTTT